VWAMGRLDPARLVLLRARHLAAESDQEVRKEWCS